MKNSFLFALVILIFGAGCTDSNKKENMAPTQKEKGPLSAQNNQFGFK